MARPDTELALGVLDALNDSQLLPNDIAAATGTTASEASDWLARRSNPPSEHIERLAELASLLDRLSHVMSLRYIPKWLSEQNPALKRCTAHRLPRNGRLRSGQTSYLRDRGSGRKLTQAVNVHAGSSLITQLWAHPRFHLARRQRSLKPTSSRRAAHPRTRAPVGPR